MILASLGFQAMTLVLDTSRFVFYLRDQPESDEGEENTADTTQAAAPCAQPAPGSPEAKNASGATGPKNAAKFRRVEVSLNPPPPAPPSPAPRKGTCSLHCACGIRQACAWGPRAVTCEGAEVRSCRNAAAYRPKACATPLTDQPL